MISHLLVRRFLIKDLVIWAIVLLVAIGSAVAAPARPAAAGAANSGHAIRASRKAAGPARPATASARKPAAPDRIPGLARRETLAAGGAIRGSLQ